jgi:heptosyltransferase-2
VTERGQPQRILIHATNWLGDAILSLPALRAVRERFPEAHIALLARPSVAGIYTRESFADEMIEYPAARGLRDLRAKRDLAARLSAARFDTALLLPNSFESAAAVWAAGIPERIGYARDARGSLLTRAIAVPRKGVIPLFEAYYYLELLRRTGWIEEMPPEIMIRLQGIEEARGAGKRAFTARGVEGAVIGVSPGAAYGTAKRWLPERFAESDARLASEFAGSVALFGSRGERDLCTAVAAMPALQGVAVQNLAGETTLAEFVDLAAACSVFLTNDSGAMHVAASVGTPTVAIFGATDHVGTGPTGDRARVVREPVECSPCLLRECPIDHRCMTGVSAGRVADVALELLK